MNGDYIVNPTSWIKMPPFSYVVCTKKGAFYNNLMVRTGDLIKDQSLEHNTRHRFRNQRQRDGRHADQAHSA